MSWLFLIGGSLVGVVIVGFGLLVGCALYGAGKSVREDCTSEESV